LMRAHTRRSRLGLADPALVGWVFLGCVEAVRLSELGWPGSHRASLAHGRRQTT
jgi:hypothetical protein